MNTRLPGGSAGIGSASILMSVYHRVEPGELCLCLDSLSAQTLMPDQIVIVKDGPVGEELERLLEEFVARSAGIVTVVPLPTNQGLIEALNFGLGYCTGEWILRMDADDVALPGRVATQLEYLQSHPDIDVLGTAMLEFDTDHRRPLRKKPVVTSHDEIKAQLPYRNPINHPTVCIRRSLLDSAGGYPPLRYLEDYFLWATLMNRGARFHNLAEPLHLYRFDANTLDRRAGRGNFQNECWLRLWMYRHKMLGPLSLLLVLALQLVLRFAPARLRQFLWRASRMKINDSNKNTD